MTEVTSVVEVESHEGVAGIEYCQEDCSVGLSTRVRLHVGVFSSEEFLDSVDGQLFHLVHHLTTAVVSLSGIAFGIFVGEAGAHGLHYLIADKVLGCNEFDASHLSLFLFFDERKHRVVSFHNLFPKE